MDEDADGLEIGAETRLARVSGVLERRTPTSVVVLGDADPMSLRGTGVAIWDLFATESSVADVVAQLAARYRAPTATVRAEIVPLLVALCRAHALHVVAPDHTEGCARPRVRDDLVAVELDGELVVYDAQHCALHHLNPTATLVWRGCDGTQSVREIATSVARAYSLDADDVIDEVVGLVESLHRSGLVDESVA